MSKISIYKDKKNAIQNIELSEFLNSIKYGKFKDAVEHVRNEVDKDKRKKLKENLYAVTISGVFKERKQENLIEHSGFIAVDIDHFNDKTALINDHYTYSLFSSVGGGGLCCIVKINPDKHKESYNWLSNYYWLNYGIVVDPAPKNVASLRFVSYDPDIFINEKSLKSKTKAEIKSKPKSTPIILEENDVGELINTAINRGVDLAPDYASYLQLGFALANGFGEIGRNYYHVICQVNPKYNSKQCDRQFDICLKGANRSGVSVGTFYFMLKNAGIELPKKNNRAIQLAAMGKKSNRTPEAVKAQLVEMEGLQENQAEQIANQVFKSTDFDLSKMASDPDALIESLINWLTTNHKLSLNCITRKLEENKQELTEQRENTIYLRSRMAFNSTDVTKDLVRSIMYSDIISEYNPITDFIDKHRHLNSTGNIDKIIAAIKTDTTNSDTFIRKWLVSIIAAYDGNAVRSVLALVGGQNTGKTEYFRRLLPAELQQYYAESKLDNGKDDELLMCEKLIVMDDEMGGKSKQDEKRFKELTSKSKFSLRAAYGRHNRDYKRLALLCGTSNDPNVINDPTGNTRILPINVLSINHEMYNEVDKKELFMELFRLYESGFEWELSKDEMIDLSELSNEFESIPFERELITQFFKNQKEGGYTEYLTSTEIKDFIEANSHQKIMNGRRFSIELTKVLGNSLPKKRNGVLIRCYPAIKINSSVTSNQLITNDNEDPF